MSKLRELSKNSNGKCEMYTCDCLISDRIPCLAIVRLLRAFIYMAFVHHQFLQGGCEFRSHSPIPSTLFSSSAVMLCYVMC